MITNHLSEFSFAIVILEKLISDIFIVLVLFFVAHQFLYSNCVRHNCKAVKN